MRSSGNLGSVKDEIYIPSSHAGGREETNFSLTTCISLDWEMQPSKVDTSMKLIRKVGPILLCNYSTRTKLIPNNQCQQPYECAAGKNTCAARTQWEVTICSRNPNAFIQS